MAHNTRKLVGVILMLSLLVAALTAFTITASAADTTVTFEFGANGSAAHKDGSSAKTDYTETVDGYTLNITSGEKMYPSSYDAKGNSCLKLGTGSAAGKFTFTVPVDVTSVIINIGKYKANTTKIDINGTAYTLSNSSNDGAYDAITVDTSSTKTVTLTTLSGGYRAMVNSIKFVAQTGGCAHTNTTEAITVPATCITAGTKTITCNDCSDYEITEPIAALGHEGGNATCTTLAVCTRCDEGYGNLAPHDFVNGTCTACGEDLPNEATVSFANTNHRTELSTTKQVWQNIGLVITHTKASSTTNIADYSNPIRFYKSSQIVISFPGMTTLAIEAKTGEYATPWDATITNAGYSAALADGIYTITFDKPVDSITLVCSAQIRAYSITATAAKQSEPACQHEYTYTCDKVCALCGEITNEAAEHTIAHVEAVNAKCTENGNIEYWYCEICGYAWADEALTQQTNLMNVIVPSTGHKYEIKVDVDKNLVSCKCACGDEQTNPIATFRGASIRYKDGATVEQLAIRFGYQFDLNVIEYIVGWSWDYEAIDGNAVVSGTQVGTAITEAGVSNLVFTDIPTKRIDGTFKVTLTLVLEIDGTQYTYTEAKPNERIIFNVLDEIKDDTTETQEARDFAQSVLNAFAALPDDDEPAVIPSNEENEN